MAIHSVAFLVLFIISAHAHQHIDHGQHKNSGRFLKNRKTEQFHALGQTYTSIVEFVESGAVCGYEHPDLEQQVKIHAELAAFREEKASERVRELSASTGIIEINVYFHVIYNSDGLGNVTDEVIYEQMRVFNEGFEGIQNRPTCWPEGVQISIPAATPFRFKLQSINRVLNNTWFNKPGTANVETQMKKALRKGTCADLNVYVTSGAGYLGWAYFPDICQDPDRIHLDGVVLAWSSLPKTRAWEYGEGDTLTHEVGHWLGLPHTFEGGCSDGDNGGANGAFLIADTPAEASAAYGCPVGRNTCSSDGIDPIDNFMDYSYDCCMFRFTPHQSRAMQEMAEFYRGLTMQPVVEAPSASPSPSVSPSHSAAPSSIPSTPSISWSVISYDDFEGNNWGSFGTRGEDCSLVSDGNLNGSWAVQLRDNSATSLLVQAAPYIISQFSYLQISFWFLMQGMDTGEDFFVEIIFDGQSWQSVGEFVLGQPNELLVPQTAETLSNSKLYFAQIALDLTSYISKPRNVRMRIRCDASANDDLVYVDDVLLQGR